MPEFYVQVRNIRTWNITVQAEDAEEAKDKGDEAVGQQPVEPDDSEWQYEAEEVKEYVE